MNAYRYALSFALLATVACSSDDDDGGGQPSAGGGAGAGGSTAAGGAGGGGDAGGGGGAGGGTTLGAGGACSTPEIELERAPQAIKDIVAEREASTVSGSNPIVRYDYTGTELVGAGPVVYYVPSPPDVSDGNSGLLAQDGTLICSPDGGFTGGGDGRCGDYASKHSAPPPAPGKSAGDPCVVWQDPRK